MAPEEPSALCHFFSFESSHGALAPARAALGSSGSPHLRGELVAETVCRLKISGATSLLSLPNEPFNLLIAQTASACRSGRFLSVHLRDVDRRDRPRTPVGSAPGAGLIIERDPQLGQLIAQLVCRVQRLGEAGQSEWRQVAAERTPRPRPRGSCEPPRPIRPACSPRELAAAAAAAQPALLGGQAAAAVGARRTQPGTEASRARAGPARIRPELAASHALEVVVARSAQRAARAAPCHGACSPSVCAAAREPIVP
eukprot:scaffold9503_cov27-Tisochrysis_lutea.AAC.5